MYFSLQQTNSQRSSCSGVGGGEGGGVGVWRTKVLGFLQTKLQGNLALQERFACEGRLNSIFPADHAFGESVSGSIFYIPLLIIRRSMNLQHTNWQTFNLVHNRHPIISYFFIYAATVRVYILFIPISLAKWKVPCFRVKLIFSLQSSHPISIGNPLKICCRKPFNTSQRISLREDIRVPFSPRTRITVRMWSFKANPR